MIYTESKTIYGKKYMWTILMKSLSLDLFLMEITLSIPVRVRKETHEEVYRRAEEIMKKLFDKPVKEVKKRKKNA